MLLIVKLPDFDFVWAVEPLATATVAELSLDEVDCTSATSASRSSAITTLSQLLELSLT